MGIDGLFSNNIWLRFNIESRSTIFFMILPLLRWPISVTTQSKLENRFQYPQHISKLATQLNGYRKLISLSTTHFQTDNTTRYLLKTDFNIHNTFLNSQHNSMVTENSFHYPQHISKQTTQLDIY